MRAPETSATSSSSLWICVSPLDMNRMPYGRYIVT